MSKTTSETNGLKKVCRSSAGRKRVVFKFKAKAGSEVFLAGSFNNWDTAAKKMDDKKGSGDFQCILML